MKKNPFIKVMTVFIVIIVGISLIGGSAILLLGNNTNENIENSEYTENEINELEIISEENNIEIEDETETGNIAETGDININEIE